MRTTSKLILNTALLTAASFLMQTVSVAFNVYLTNRIGELGIGLFQLTMTVYGMAATFACAGVRLGATRLNIDLLAKQPEASSRGAMRLCLGYAFVLSCTMGVALFLAAPLAATQWLSDPRATQALRWLALGLPFVSVTAAMQGYFTAVRTVFKSAAAQGVEQAVKIAAVVFFLGRMLPMGMEYACLAIVYGMCAGEVVALVFSALLLRSAHSMRRRDAPGQAQVKLRALLHIAGPEAAGTCVRSVLLTVEHLLIPRGFQAAGRSAEDATRIYGVIHGMSLPVLLYPSAVLSSLAGLLVPEFSLLRIDGRHRQIETAVRKILRLSLFYGVFIGGMFYAFAAPLSQRIYGSDIAAKYLQLLSPLVPVMYVDMSVDGMLKGLDQQKYSMRYNIIDSGMCVVLVSILLPRLAIKGYIIVLFISEIYNFFFSLRRLLVVTGVPRPRLAEIAKPLLCTACAALIPLGLSNAAAPGGLGSSTLRLVLALGGGAVFYFVALYLIGSVTREDFKAVKVGGA
ncbi:MAG: polysaccharide biosynthesis C-terminal domain-containing protein [Oscillospiraceae bacterium]|jgi:stage V sporulation protein B|nr:polysaccharide biosynthesis C-terminal domain-containing protein [Oscillospiraceae bacterium]